MLLLGVGEGGVNEIHALFSDASRKRLCQQRFREASLTDGISRRQGNFSLMCQPVQRILSTFADSSRLAACRLPNPRSG